MLERLLGKTKTVVDIDGERHQFKFVEVGALLGEGDEAVVLQTEVVLNNGSQLRMATKQRKAVSADRSLEGCGILRECDIRSYDHLYVDVGGRFSVMDDWSDRGKNLVISTNQSKRFEGYWADSIRRKPELGRQMLDGDLQQLGEQFREEQLVRLNERRMVVNADCWFVNYGDQPSQIRGGDLSFIWQERNESIARQNNNEYFDVFLDHMDRCKQLVEESRGEWDDQIFW